MVKNLENYYCYTELVEQGVQTIYTKDINNENVDKHFQGIINILNDGIETEEVQNLMIHVVFPDDDIDLFIIQYMYNLMFWSLICYAGEQIMSKHLFFEEIITKKAIKAYVDKYFIRKNLTKMKLIDLNQNIDRCIGKFRMLENYQQWLCNTLSLKDTTDFMEEFPEFADTLHVDVSNIPMEDIKDYGREVTKTHIKYITRADRDHSMKYTFSSGEGTNEKQYQELAINIGTLPNGQGSVFRHPINSSFINGGLRDEEDVVIDSSIGRIAQILQKQNVGQSGAFSRKLGMNNQDSRLHIDPNYRCDTVNYEEVTIRNEDFLKAYDMRYYRFNPNGIEYKLDATTDKHLIGQRLYFRSPMTCASAARNHGICYRCYGDLAYVENLNIGQLASELLGSIYTQLLLSAKHQLESAIIKMQWTEEFYDLFDVEFDQITLRDYEYKKYKLIINVADIIEEDSEDNGDEGEFENTSMAENYYVYSFDVKKPDGSIVTIKTANNDPIYLHNDLVEKMNLNEDEDDDVYEMDMAKLKDISLFIVNVRNNELSVTMKKVKNLIDHKASIKVHDKNSIIEEFISTNLQGNIRLNAVHFEVILMNQIRGEDLLTSPDWSQKNPEYQIITLDKALSDNKSITVRMQSNKLKRALNHPDNQRLYQSSNMDLFAMVHPQEFMSREFKSSLPEDQQDKPIINPLFFTDDYKGKR